MPNVGDKTWGDYNVTFDGLRTKEQLLRIYGHDWYGLTPEKVPTKGYSTFLAPSNVSLKLTGAVPIVVTWMPIKSTYDERLYLVQHLSK